MYLDARVYPRAGRNRIELAPGPKLKVYVTAPPEGGKANDAVIRLLAKQLGVPLSSIQIVRGQRGRNKLLYFDQLTEEELLARLPG